MKFIENMIYRMAVYLLAWSLLRFDKRHGGKHQNLTSGCTFVTVFGKARRTHGIFCRPLS